MLQHIARVLRLTQLFALLLVIGMGALLYSVLAQVERAGSWVDHTHKVVDEIAAVRLDSLRAGLWLRNFVISPRKESLERSRASAAHATQAVRHLMDLTGDNPAQHQTMQLLQSELAEVLGIYLSSVNIAERDGVAALQSSIAVRVNNDFTQELRRLLDHAENVERDLLQHRSEVERERFATLKRLLAVSGVAFIAITLWAVRFSTRLLRASGEQVHALQAHALQDPLTGLLNRRGLEQQLARMDACSRPDDRHLGVVVFDLDEFKPVNDRHGHAAGDQVLQEVARRLQQQCRAGDAIARVGGDEFVVALSAVHSRSEAAAIAQRIHARLTAPIGVGAAQVRIGASIGLAMLHDDGDNAQALLRCADAQMYAAKQAGKLRKSGAAGQPMQLVSA